MVECLYSMPGSREKEEPMECKNCGALLEEGQTVCPDCGQSVKVKKEKKKSQSFNVRYRLLVYVLYGFLVYLKRYVH